MSRLFLPAIFLVLAACHTQPKTQVTRPESIKTTTAAAVPCGITGVASCAGCPSARASEAVIVSVDSVQKNPEKYFDKTIALQGRVIHTCKVSGKKMFLSGSDDQQLIRINAGENISRFDESLQGRIVVVKGVLTPVTEMVPDTEKDGKTACITDGKAKQYVVACSEFEVLAQN